MVRVRKEQQRDRRINKLKFDDAEIWRSNESDRLTIDMNEQSEKLSNEGLMEDAEERAERFNRRRSRFETARKNSPVPDHILEMDQTIDRDTLRDEERWSEEYEAPPNYYNKELKTPQWRTPRHKEGGGVTPMRRSAFQKKYQAMQEELMLKKASEKKQQREHI